MMRKDLDAEMKLITTGMGWRSILRPLDRFVDEAKFVVSDEGLHAAVVDASHVMMVEYDIGHRFFSKYELMMDKATVGLALKQSLDLLCRPLAMQKGVNVEFVLNPAKRYAKFRGWTREGVEFRNSSMLVDADGIGEPKVPNLNTPFKAKMKSIKPLLGVIKDASRKETAPDSIAFALEKDVENPLIMTMRDGHVPEVDASLSCEREFANDYRFGQEHVELDWNEKKEIDNAAIGKKCRSLYPFDHFQNIIEGIVEAFNEDVPIEMTLGSDYPIRFDVGGIKDGHGKRMMVLLAPRIESE